MAWLFLCVRLDRTSPEPKKQILRIFLWGGFMVFPVLLITGPLSTAITQIKWLSDVVEIFILSFMLDGLFEEWAKYSILSEKIYRSKFFDEPRDGIVYGMVIGIGFSFVENILYSLTFIDLKEGLLLAITRGVATTFMHLLAGGIIGYYFGLAKFSEKGKSKLIWRGFILAILFHGFYNTVIRFGYIWTLIPLILVLIGTYLLILRGLRRMSRPPR